MLNKLKFIYAIVKNNGFIYFLKKYILKTFFRTLNFGPRYIALRTIEFYLPRAHRCKYTLPSYLQLESTSRCNLNCRNCTRDMLSKFGDLSIDNFFHIIKQFPFLKEVKLQGLGEPLLNHSVFEMASALKKRRIITYVATNGTLITEQIAARMVKYFDKIEISIDSPDRQLLKDIRGGDCMDDVLKGAKILSSVNENSDIAINFVMEKTNASQLSAMVKLTHSLGIDHINIVSLQNWVSMLSKYKHRREELSERGVGEDCSINGYLKDAVKLAKSFGIYVDFSLPSNQKGKCFWHKNGVYISWNGYVTPCCMRPNYEEFNFGNIFEKCIRDIWNSQPYVEFREALDSGRIPSVCKGCSYI